MSGAYQFRTPELARGAIVAIYGEDVVSSAERAIDRRIKLSLIDCTDTPGPRRLMAVNELVLTRVAGTVTSAIRDAVQDAVFGKRGVEA